MQKVLGTEEHDKNPLRPTRDWDSGQCYQGGSIYACNEGIQREEGTLRQDNFWR